MVVDAKELVDLYTLKPEKLGLMHRWRRSPGIEGMSRASPEE